MLDASATGWHRTPCSSATTASATTRRCWRRATGWRGVRIRWPGWRISTCCIPSRRRWRGVYENCRLATVERQLLRVVREDDLPGAQAPAAWLSYLRGGSPHMLRRVLAHNHQDVVSLSRLLRRVSGDGDACDAGRTRTGG